MRILVLEDQTESREALVRIIKSISEEIKMTAIASEKEAMAAIASDGEYDLFLLDINLDSTHLADTSGMNVARAIRELQRYRYITKPFRTEEVEKIIRKVMTHTGGHKEERSVTIKKDGINYKVWCDDILFIQAVPRGLRLVLKTERLDIRYLTLKQLLPRLPEGEFIQCHRMYIVNRRYIDYVDTVNRVIKLRGCKEQVEIGVTYKAQIRGLLNE